MSTLVTTKLHQIFYTTPQGEDKLEEYEYDDSEDALIYATILINEQNVKNVSVWSNGQEIPL